jgi:hypothetical protein
LRIGFGGRLRHWRGQRKVLVAGWAALFAMIGGGLAARFEVLLREFVDTPRPHSAPASAPTLIPQQTVGQVALSTARDLIERGDVVGALAALDRVQPSEPAYPFARQLRVEAEAALRAPRVNR